MEDALAQAAVVRFGIIIKRLNPCCNGRCTRTVKGQCELYALNVLILVVMEDALVRESIVESSYPSGVLILVVMEDALVQKDKKSSDC